jgi:glycosyltransferase involved in cell wall biosynthesis
MKILYIANSRIPTEKAHGIQIMKTCEALTANGAMVELVVPVRKNAIKTDPFIFYSVKKPFQITRLPGIDLVDNGRIGFMIQTLVFSLKSFFYILRRTDKNDIIFSRDTLPMYFATFVRKHCIWEVHERRSGFLVRRLLKKCKKIITITDGLKKLYVKQGAHQEKIAVIADGVDVASFRINENKQAVKGKLKLHGPKVVMYTGHLYEWKGVNALAEAATHAPEHLFVFVGGTDKHIFDFKQRYPHPNIRIVGQRPHNEIPLYLRAADVVVLPNSGKYEISSHFTSPLKLFEYMASGTPIVASDLPSLREVLDEETAVLVEPDNALALAKGISKIVGDEDFGNTLAAEAIRRVDKYSWDNRAKEILKLLA